MWLLEQDKAREMRHALLAGLAPSAQDREAHLRRETEAEAAASMPRNMSVAGDVAEIKIEGTLTPKFDLFAYLFGDGNTTYEQIQAALAVADADPNIKRVSFYVDSPGGLVNGLFETLAAIERFSKPITVRASRAASAAYAIAATAGPITATSKAASFGSIGVVSTFFNDEALIDVVSTEAPNKRPDITTEEGKAVVREYLDAVHDIFVDAIARGRTAASGTKVTPKTVNSDFGRGSMFVASDAKARNMVDKLPGALRAVGQAAHELTAPNTDSTADGGGAGSKENQMDLQTLKTQHPEVYAAVLREGEEKGLAKGVEQGTKDERKRVIAHLNLGGKCGAMDIALKAIRDGSDFFDAELQSEYIGAGVNKRDRQARQDDSDAAGKVLDGAKAHDKAEDLGDRIVALLEQDRDEKGAK